jgi:NADH-quinone oxidoreductase subunit D
MKTREMLLNVGPAHPAMHGIIRIVTALDGERIVDIDVEIGYLHRGFEKMAETVDYNGVMPYTDRLNYVSPLINNMGYCMAVEKLLGMAVPDRCHYIRVIMSEISRIGDHLTCVGASAMELGAFTVFLYMIKAREYLWDLVEMVTGARLTVTYCRVGGVKADLPAGFAEACANAFKETRLVIKESDTLLTRNRIFVDRMSGTGRISAEDAISHGITGPFLRGCGVAYDVRKDCPYAVYDRLEFDVPVGTRGDNLDRYMVRMEEMEQSMRIVEQALREIPDGPVHAGQAMDTPMPAAEMIDRAKVGDIRSIADTVAVTDPTLDGSARPLHLHIAADEKRVFLPPKEDTYGNIEGLMQHFKLVMYGHGIQPPPGEVYFPVEGANGELGFYIVSDGSSSAYRVRVRPPCFAIMSALPKLLIGDMIADLTPTFGSVNLIGGELDR